jgi:hypothetical protein
VATKLDLQILTMDVSGGKDSGLGLKVLLICNRSFIRNCIWIIDRAFSCISLLLSYLLLDHDGLLHRGISVLVGNAHKLARFPEGVLGWID